MYVKNCLDKTDNKLMELYREVQASLKFIARIQVGDKINVDSMTIYPVGLWSSISRTLWYPDGRNKTLSFLHDSVNRALELIRCYEQSPTQYTTILRRNIIVDLDGTKVGLEKLKETYSTDLKFQCEIDTLRQLVEAASDSRTDTSSYFTMTASKLPSYLPNDLEEIDLVDSSG